MAFLGCNEPKQDQSAGAVETKSKTTSNTQLFGLNTFLDDKGNSGAKSQPTVSVHGAKRIPDLSTKTSKLKEPLSPLPSKDLTKLSLKSKEQRSTPISVRTVPSRSIANTKPDRPAKVSSKKSTSSAKPIRSKRNAANVADSDPETLCDQKSDDRNFEEEDTECNSPKIAATVDFSYSVYKSGVFGSPTLRIRKAQVTVYETNLFSSDPLTLNFGPFSRSGDNLLCSDLELFYSSNSLYLINDEEKDASNCLDQLGKAPQAGLRISFVSQQGADLKTAISPIPFAYQNQDNALKLVGISDSCMVRQKTKGHPVIGHMSQAGYVSTSITIDEKADKYLECRTTKLVPITTMSKYQIQIITAYTLELSMSYRFTDSNPIT